MYTIIAILLFFLIAIFGTLLYYRTKKSTLSLLEDGICPACHSEAKSFRDETTGTLFKVEYSY